MLWFHYWLFHIVLFFNIFFLLKFGKTALHFAALNGFEQIVKILIEHGSNVHLQNIVFIFFFFYFHFYFFVFLIFVVLWFIIGCFVL